MGVVTVGDQLRSMRLALTEAGIEAARHEAALLIGARTGQTLAKIYSHPEFALTPEQSERLDVDLQRRLAHEPIAYILGETEFYGLSFAVGPGVLIPRADTERLVEIALEQVLTAFPDSQTLRILDTCTGTGCAGISLACQLHTQNRSLQLDLIDLNPQALTYTQANVDRHQLQTVTRVLHADLWPDALQTTQGQDTQKLCAQSAAGAAASDDASMGSGQADIGADASDDAPRGSGQAITNTECYDVILANPPYIVQTEVPELMPDVSRFEPWSALDGGADGLDFYLRLANEAHRWLKRPGLLLLEHGFDQALPVEAILAQAGFSNRLTVYDYGGHPRVTGGWLV